MKPIDAIAGTTRGSGLPLYKSWQRYGPRSLWPSGAGRKLECCRDDREWGFEAGCL